MSTQPLTIFHLSGTEAQMGRQHGELQRQLGGHQPALDYYPQMPLHMLRGSQPSGAMRTLPGLIAPAIDALTRRLYGQRPADLRERGEAYAQALGLPAEMARHSLAMDVFQNLVGVAGRVRVVPAAQQVAAQALAACSSLAVWGPDARDSGLLHARNFDFPGNGIWDAAPTVVLCTPSQGLRYGYASTRGNDAPVVSLWNEAGLCLTTHTRLHTQVRFGGAAIVDLCHEIIRNASTLAQAEQIVRQRPIASTWGLLVSSASEGTAVLIETHARGVAVTRPTTTHLASTNHYLAAELRPGELAPNSGYSAHSHGRLHRLERAVREAKAQHGLSAADLQALLGDHQDGERAGVERGAGGVLAQPTGVHSIVMDPLARRCFVSTGPAPAGRGSYTEVPWTWQRTPGVEEVAPERSTQPDRRGVGLATSRFDDGPGAAGYQHFFRAVQLECHGAEPAATAVHIARAAAADPNEPTWQLLHAGFAMRSGDFDEAATALDRGLELEQTPFYRARFLLWASRVAAQRGRLGLAADLRSEQLGLRHPLCEPLHAAARQDAERPFAAAQFRQVPIQCFMAAVG